MVATQYTFSWAVGLGVDIRMKLHQGIHALGGGTDTLITTPAALERCGNNPWLQK
jgi:hypothetical protein